MSDFKTSRGLEQAVKEAAKQSGRPVQKVQEEFWRSRLLARIFQSSGSRFVLKGGTGLLARVPDARKTRDLDLAVAQDCEDETALTEIEALAKIDLLDHCRFELISSTSIQQEAAYRRGYNLKFKMHIGTREVAAPVNIDLVIGCSPTSPIEVLFPKNMENLPLNDVEYSLYPLVDHIADKVCAIMETHNGHESSRIKDLVDLVVIALNQSVLLERLAIAIDSESKMRGIAPIEEFAIPGEWMSYPGRYRKMTHDTAIDEFYRSQNNAVELTKKFINPALLCPSSDLIWDPATTECR
jgi:predicted nucleotidyltransferase component of viral defense system